MMSDTVVAAIYGVVGTFVAALIALIGVLIKRRQRDGEDIVEGYRTLLETLQDDVRQLRRQIREQGSEIVELKDANWRCQEDNRLLRQRLAGLESRI